MRMGTDIVTRDSCHQQHPHILGRRVRPEVPPVLMELVLRHHKMAGRHWVGPDVAEGDERALRHLGAPVRSARVLRYEVMARSAAARTCSTGRSSPERSRQSSCIQR